MKKVKIISKKPQEIVIYRGSRGNVTLRADISKDTIWATQAQIAELFDVNVRTINEHLGNIFRTKELDKDSVIRKFRITARDVHTFSFVQKMHIANLNY